MLLKDYLAQFPHGAATRLAEHLGKRPQTIHKWCSKDYTINECGVVITPMGNLVAFVCEGFDLNKETSGV